MRKIGRTLTYVAVAGSILSGCSAAEEAPSANSEAPLGCEYLNRSKVAKQPVQSLAAAIRRCHDSFPSGQIPAGANTLAVRLPTLDGGRVELAVDSDALPSAPDEEYAQKATRVMASTYTGRDESTLEGKYHKQRVTLSNGEEPPRATWSTGGLKWIVMRVGKTYPNSEKPRVRIQTTVPIDTPRSLHDPEVVQCVRSEIIDQITVLVGAASFERSEIPVLTIPDLSGGCGQV